jgi:hypothetical protein
LEQTLPNSLHEFESQSPSPPQSAPIAFFAFGLHPSAPAVDTATNAPNTTAAATRFQSFAFMVLSSSLDTP